MTQTLRDVIKSYAPGLWLLTNRPWREMQDAVDSAAILTHTVTKAGFFNGYPNLHPCVLLLAKPVPPGSTMAPSTAASLEELMDEFMSRVDLPEPLFFSDEFSDKILGSSRWTGEDLAKVLNHNLQIIREPVKYENLPKPRDLALEQLYGLVLSKYRDSRSIPELRSMVVSVPLLTAARVTESEGEIIVTAFRQSSHIKDTAPSVRKAIRISDKMLLSEQWMEKFETLFPEAKLLISGNDPVALRLFLEDVIDKSRNGPRTEGKPFVGARIRKHLRYICRQLNGMVTKTDEVWGAQRDVLSLSADRHDYRSSGDLDLSLFKGLEQALVRLPTNIQVANMAVLRNPRKHFLYSFLEAKVGDRASCSEDELMADLVFAANLRTRLQSFGMYKSDWKNGVAVYWNRKASDPAHFDLALDLYPDAHAFSFTYGRQNGYALPNKYRASLTWLCQEADGRQKSYFLKLIGMESHPRAISFLDSIPAALRAEARNVKTGEPTNNFLKKLDDWLASEEGAASPCAEVCKQHVQAAKDKLPVWLHKKLPEKLKLVSVVALFSYLMENFDGPAALASTFHQKAPIVDI